MPKSGDSKINQGLNSLRCKPALDELHRSNIHGLLSNHLMKLLSYAHRLKSIVLVNWHLHSLPDLSTQASEGWPELPFHKAWNYAAYRLWSGTAGRKR